MKFLRRKRWHQPAAQEASTGKRIVLVDNGKFGADNFLYVVAQLIKQKYPNTTVVMDPKPSAQTITDLPKWYPTVKQQGDLFVFGVGD